MTRYRVAITIRSFDVSGPAMADLLRFCEITYRNTTGKRLSEEDLVQAVRGAEGVIAGTEKFTKRVIASSRDLRAISRVGVGTDSIDLRAARERGISISTTPDSVTQAVAEHTLTLILAVMKRIGVYALAMRSGNDSAEPGSLLQGKTAGIIGLGRIGRRVASLLSCLGCRIAFYDPLPKEGIPRTWQVVPSLEELAAMADILTLHASLQADEPPLLDARILSLCREGAIIINTARGGLVDERALETALESGRISGAGLDVFQQEPYQGPLLHYPQVLATPHVASHTTESRRMMEEEAVENLVRAMKHTGD